MSEQLVIRPARARPRRRFSLQTALASGAGAPTPASIDGPRLMLTEPEDDRSRVVTGAATAALHAAALGALVLTAALAPPELIERVIPVELVPTRQPVDVQGSSSGSPAAAPKQVGLNRPNAAALAASQTLSPAQAAALRASALEAARRAIEQVQVDSTQAPTLPTQVARREVNADRVAARAAAAASPTRIEPTRLEAPRIDPEDLAAVAPSLEGPRRIDPSSLTDLSTPEALAVLSAIPESDYSGTVDATSLPSGGVLGGPGVAVGIDTGVAGEWTAAGGPGGTGGAGATGAGGTGGGPPGLGGDGATCLGSAAVQQYIEGLRVRTNQRWIVPAGVTANEQVVLRFDLDQAGMANDVAGSDSDDPSLSDSARQALLSAAPFPPLNDGTRCLAEKRIVVTFTVPAR